MSIPIIGGPLDGKTTEGGARFLRVPSTPILRTTWNGESFVHEFTEHTYRFKNGSYRWQGCTHGPQDYASYAGQKASGVGEGRR